MGLSDRLNLDLAWAKSKSNLRDNSRIFLNSPHVVDFLDNNQDEWLNHLSIRLENDDYSPDKCRVINVPKPDFHIRPGGVLNLSDLVIYSALTIDIYDDIREEIKWSSESSRFSRILFEDKTDRGWIKFPGETWQRWNDKSRELADSHDYVLFADIAGFFENIQFKQLLSELNSLQISEEVLGQLMKCLRRWAEPSDQSLPQGYYPSDILSELYLNRIDERLKLEGFTHTRFSDNFRIYCESHDEAIDALRILTERFREKSLNVQREKTTIVTGSEAVSRLLEPEKRIIQIADYTGGKIEEGEGGSPYDGSKGKPKTWNPYTDGGEMGENPLDSSNIDQALLEHVFERDIEESNVFNKHLFRYLITRLGIVDSHEAIPFCLSHISEGKPETRAILDRYLKKLSDKEDAAVELAGLIHNGELKYQFQKFAILRWFWETEIESDVVAEAVRKELNHGNLLRESKHYCLAYLGKMGAVGDLEFISEMYEDNHDPVTRAIILCSIARMERSMRNSIYSRAEEDNIFSQFAVSYSKEALD